jgi:polyisoprenoid-binding protein YceI
MFHGFLMLLSLTVSPGPGFPPASSGGMGVTAPDTIPSRWVLAPQGSEARYRVREQLAGFDFPNDAVGVTSRVSGSLVLGPGGSIVPGESEFRVRLDSLTSDSQRRDAYVRRRTLEVDRYPEAVLVPRRIVDLPSPPPDSGSVSFRLEGDLTVHGHTRPTVWEVSAEFGPGAITGMATTAFPFDTFGITIPQVARVLSVDDNIRLEIQFRMVREG